MEGRSARSSSSGNTRLCLCNDNGFAHVKKVHKIVRFICFLFESYKLNLITINYSGLPTVFWYSYRDCYHLIFFQYTVVYGI